MAINKFISTFLAFSLIWGQTASHAQSVFMSTLPQPGQMVSVTPAFTPVMIKGLKVHPENPLLFDFIMDVGKTSMKIDSKEFKDESQKLIKYFLASLTIKEDDLWVNLSPYEKDRMIVDELGKTELGRDMLAQDYILKQLTASLIYPDKDFGKAFWERVYAKAQEQFGTSHIPVDTFNKVWIVADKAKVLETDNAGYVVAGHLKVMLEEDYVAINKQMAVTQTTENNKAHTVASAIVREVIVPEIEKEVNQGKNFATLRQMFYSMILASWYKKALRKALLNQVYSNKAKTDGVLTDDPDVKEKIYQQYLEAYKKGVFNYIKEDVNINRQTTPRKYFSGGEDFSMLRNVEITNDTAQANGLFDDVVVLVTVKILKQQSSRMVNEDAAMQSDIDKHIEEAVMQLKTSKAVLFVLLLLQNGSTIESAFSNDTKQEVVKAFGLPLLKIYEMLLQNKKIIIYKRDTWNFSERLRVLIERVVQPRYQQLLFEEIKQFFSFVEERATLEMLERLNELLKMRKSLRIVKVYDNDWNELFVAMSGGGSVTKQIVLRLFDVFDEDTKLSEQVEEKINKRILLRKDEKRKRDMGKVDSELSSAAGRGDWSAFVKCLIDAISSKVLGDVDYLNFYLLHSNLLTQEEEGNYAKVITAAKEAGLYAVIANERISRERKVSKEVEDRERRIISLLNEAAERSIKQVRTARSVGKLKYNDKTYDSDFGFSNASGDTGTLEIVTIAAVLSSLLSSKDSAMIENGGIDLNSKNMGLDIAKNGNGIDMKFDPAMVAEFKSGDFSGVTPVIIMISHIQNPMPTLGLE